MTSLPTPERWWRLEMEERQRVMLEVELRKELGRGHPLEGVELRAVAKCEGCDEAVFELPNNAFVVVHLTWKGEREHDPRWPHAEPFASWDACVQALRQHTTQLH